MKVIKFGGTSVGSASQMQKVAELIRNEKQGIVVLSAMSGITDKLIKVIELWKNSDIDTGIKIINEIRNKFENTIFELFKADFYKAECLKCIDKTIKVIYYQILLPYNKKKAGSIVAQGELITSYLFYNYLKSNGFNTAFLKATDFIVLNEIGEPDIEDICYRLNSEIISNEFKLIITQGFICKNNFGEISNLGRGGSDYTATLIGAAIKADQIEIWTDIDGIQNNDPRVVDKTFSIRELSYEEAAELAYFGAKILHPTCVLPAQSANIPIWLRNTMDADNPGSIIKSNVKMESNITAIAAKDGITTINIRSDRMLNAYGFLVKVFKVFEEFYTPIDMITTSEVAVSLTIDNPKYINEIRSKLDELGSVTVDYNQVIICIVGDLLATQKGIAANIFNVLKNIPIRMISYGGSENNISILVSPEYKKEALNTLNNELFTFKNYPIYV